MAGLTPLDVDATDGLGLIRVVCSIQKSNHASIYEATDPSAFACGAASTDSANSYNG